MLVNIAASIELPDFLICRVCVLYPLISFSVCKFLEYLGILCCKCFHRLSPLELSRSAGIDASYSHAFRIATANALSRRWRKRASHPSHSLRCQSRTRFNTFFCSGRNGSHGEDVPQVESMSGEVLPSPSLHRSRFALKLCPIHLLPVSRKTEARLIFALHMVLLPRVEERLHVLQVQVPNMEAHETPGVQIAPAIWHVHTGNATKRTVAQAANGWCRSGT